jgi:nucleoside-diphosphate-sugar epimerase
MQLIVGAGPVGSTIARLLAECGERVRLVTRSGSGPDHPRIERIAADAADAATLLRLAEGAATVYNCANPPYHRWPELWPPMADAMAAAAKANDAVLAVCGNLYGYGPVDGPMTENLPLATRTVKGRVRVDMWQRALAGGGRVTEVRGADYIGLRNSVLEMALPAMRAGRTAWLPMPLGVPHSFTFVEDMAWALITLAGDERAWGRAWHVPSPPPMTVRELLARAAVAGGLAEPRLRHIPAPVVRAYGVFDPMAREFAEMAYQFQRPFVLDSTLTAGTFGLQHTDVDEGLRVMLASAPAGRPTAAR